MLKVERVRLSLPIVGSSGTAIYSIAYHGGYMSLHPTNSFLPICRYVTCIHPISSSGDCSQHNHRLFARQNLLRKGSVGSFMGPVLSARKETEVGATLQGYMIAYCAAEHGIIFFKCVEDAVQRHGFRDVEAYFFTDAREVPQMMRKLDAYRHR